VKKIGVDLLSTLAAVTILTMTAVISKALQTSIFRNRGDVKVSVGEVSEACHGRRVRQELSEPSAVSSLYVQVCTIEKVERTGDRL
jgi:hypothetical protein